MRGPSPATALLSVAVKTIAMPANSWSECPLFIVNRPSLRARISLNKAVFTIVIYRAISVTFVTVFFHDVGEEPEEFPNEFARGYSNEREARFWGWGWPRQVDQRKWSAGAINNK